MARPLPDFLMPPQPAPPPAHRLVEALQRGDLTREDIASSITQLSGEHTDLANQLQQRQIGLHKFCAALNASEGGAQLLDKCAYALTNARVSLESAHAAEQARSLQREQSRARCQRAEEHNDERYNYRW